MLNLDFHSIIKFCVFSCFEWLCLNGLLTHVICLLVFCSLIDTEWNENTLIANLTHLVAEGLMLTMLFYASMCICIMSHSKVKFRVPVKFSDQSVMTQHCMIYTIMVALLFIVWMKHGSSDCTIIFSVCNMFWIFCYTARSSRNYRLIFIQFSDLISVHNLYQ